MCFGALRARHADLDPILELPYRPAACELPHYEAGHTKAPDHMLEPEETPYIRRGVHTRMTAAARRRRFNTLGTASQVYAGAETSIETV